MIEVPQVKAQDLLVSTRTDSSVFDRLMANDVLLFGFDCTSEESCNTAYSLLVALSDELRNKMPVAFVSLKTNLGASSSIRKKVRVPMTSMLFRQACVPLEAALPPCSAAISVV